MFLGQSGKIRKSQEFLSSMQMKSFVPNIQLYTLHILHVLLLFEKVVDQRASFSYPNRKILNYLVLKDWSVASLVSPAGQEKYSVLLICSLEKHFHFQGTSLAMSGETIRQDVYEP